MIKTTITTKHGVICESVHTRYNLMKLLRIKNIETNNGNTLISEGLDANFYDIFNYAVFALIKLNEKIK